MAISLAGQAVASVVTVGLGTIIGSAGRSIAYLSNWIKPNESWGIDSYIWAYQNKWIQPEVMAYEARTLGFEVTALPADLNKLFKFDGTTVSWTVRVREGIQSTVADMMMVSRKNLPDTGTALDLFNRGLLGENEAKYIISQAFSGEDALGDAIFELHNQIPGAGDLVNFAVRDCFSPEIVSTFEYNKELPTAILPYMKAQGLAGEINIPMPRGSTTTEGADNRAKPQWFDMYWWSHWQLPSIGQGYEMLQRLYPTSVYGPNPEVKPSTYFSQQQLELLQKANDYPPFWRERLQAIAYVPLQKRDINKLYKYGQLQDKVGDRSLFHAIKAHGYSDADALRLTAMVKQDNNAAQKDLSLAQIKELFHYGAISRDDYKFYLQKLEYPAEEIDLIIANTEFQIKITRFKEIIPLVHDAYVAGDMSKDDARATLVIWDIWEQRIKDLLQMWDLELKVSHKFLNLTQSVEMFKKGLVNEVQLRLKLARLHYTDNEIDLVILKAKQDVFIEQQAVIEKTAKQLQKQQDMLDKQQDKANKAAVKQITDQSKQTAKMIAQQNKNAKSPFTEKNIISFAKGGFLNWPQINKILSDKGWLLPDIYRWVLTYTPDIQGLPKDAKEKASSPK